MKRANQINKADFIEELGTQLQITPSRADQTLNTVIKLVYGYLREGKTVNWSGFGQFSISRRASRIGVNPRNPSQKITIPELNTPKFKAGEAFKEAVKLVK